jgi:hypothetical protein
MNRNKHLMAFAVVALSLAIGGSALAQYAVGHRSFGGGTSFGAGFTRMDFQFPGVDKNQPFYLLPTLEFKLFFSDKLSLDLSAPVVNIAASNALQDYFFVTGEAYLDFHPSAPGSFELFVAPGFGVSYASWEDEDANLSDSGYAFHVPVRVGMEFSNARRNFSVIVAVRPFFSLVHGGDGGNSPGGGALVEIGLMAYSINYRADRY